MYFESYQQHQKFLGRVYLESQDNELGKEFPREQYSLSFQYQLETILLDIEQVGGAVIMLI